MKIAFDGRGINWYKGTGIGTYSENILSHMINIDKNNQYHIYWSGTDYKRFKKNNTNIILTSKKQRKFFEQNYFSSYIEKKGIDLYHIPQNGIGMNKNLKCKKVVTIHDLIPYIMPETVGRGYQLKFLRELPKIVELSDAIITVSEWSKKDILRFFPINEDKIFVTPLAADKKYTPMDKERCQDFIKSNYNIKPPFILYIGGFSARKNVKSLLIAFSNIHKNLPKDYTLVIVGNNKDQFSYLSELSKNLNLENKIIFTGFVPNQDLPVFYNACDTFVYPSLYEGFGLPPLEAMSCGVPVISSNITSIPEVVGNSGILIDPNNISMLSQAIEELLSNEPLRQYYSNKSLKTAKKYSWENTAKLTLDVYNTILNK